MIYLLCSSLFVIGLLLTILSSIAFNKLTNCDSPKLKLNLNFALCIGSGLMAFAASYALCIIKCGCNTNRESLNMYILPFVFAIGIYTSVLSKSIMDESKRCGVEIGSFPVIILSISILQTVVVGLYLMYLLYKKFKPKPKPKDVKEIELTDMSKSSTSSTPSTPIAKPVSNVEVTSLPTLDSSTLSTDLITPPTPPAAPVAIGNEDVSASSDVSTDVPTDVSSDVSTVASDVSTVASDVSTVASDVSTVASDVSTVASDVSTVASTDISSSNCDNEELVLKTCRAKYPLPPV
jgi:outer membrane murein-binding lipoprotein Lpp